MANFLSCLLVEHGHEDGEAKIPEDDPEFIEELDSELKYYDDNNDGAISFAEFMKNHHKRHADQPT